MINGTSRNHRKWQFWVDRGGTFTDAIGMSPDSTLYVTKVLSDPTPLAASLQRCPIREGGQLQDSLNTKSSAAAAEATTTKQTFPLYSDTARAIRRILKLGHSDPFPSELVESIKIGTTVGTNALLERRGTQCVYITTRGFKDALLIRHQTRSDIFALHVVRPEPLYHQVIEVDERVTANGEVVVPIQPRALELLKHQLEDLRRREPQIQSCAIVLIHSYLYPNHEIEVYRVCRDVGFEYVYPSYATEPIPKLIPRAETTIVDAYLTPLLSRYISQVADEVGTVIPSSSPTTEGGVGMGRKIDGEWSRNSYRKSDVPACASSYMSEALGPRLFFTKSDGGLAEAQYFRGRDSLLSGPAAGIVGAWKVGQSKGFNRLISFDMGGTSTDVSHIDGRPSQRVECEVGGVSLCRSSVDVNSVANGGSSVVKFDGSRLLVGPTSAGSFPGPACYRNKGPLTITDCNVVLGRIQPDSFPKLFGEHQDQAIDVNVIRIEFERLRQEIIQSYDGRRVITSCSVDCRGQTGQTGRTGQTGQTGQTVNSHADGTHQTTHQDPSDSPQDETLPEWMLSIEGIAERFIEIAVQQMGTAIKKITSHRGVYIGDHTLCCFGGAGGQHACLIAECLGLKQILIHPLASVLSAVGIGMASVTQTAQAAVGVELTQRALEERVTPLAYELGLKVSNVVAAQKIPVEVQTIKLNLRLGFRNTESLLVVGYHVENASSLLARISVKDGTVYKVSTTMKDPMIPLPKLVDVKYSSDSLPPLPQTLLGRTAVSLQEEFLIRHQQEFGFCLSREHPIDIVSLEAEATSESPSTTMTNTRLTDWKIKIIDDTGHAGAGKEYDDDAEHTEEKGPVRKRGRFCRVFFSGQWYEIPILWFPTVAAVPGEAVGPLLIVDAVSSNVVLPGWHASWDFSTGLLLTRLDDSDAATAIAAPTPRVPRPAVLEVSDPFWLELFNHYFQSVAQEMGVILQRTCQSINIKERLDFSCACFDASGQLIASAPHIPVHLGSMGDSVVSLIRSTESSGGRFQAGQVFVSNNPFNGGSHLPDITVITPVFLSRRPDERVSSLPSAEDSATTNTTTISQSREDDILIAFVASRGHHTDVGGISPGSMPVISRRLDEEGVLFDNVLLVEPITGRFREEEVLSILKSGRWPARNPGLNVADLKAQIAANQRGVEELRRGATTFGVDVMKAYMNHILDGGEKAVKEVIKQLLVTSGRDWKSSFICPMDGGTQICVQMQMDPLLETMTIDFTNTSATDPFNYNAPLSVLRSAVLYVFRTLIDAESSVPLNQGCFRPLLLIVPFDCILNPRPDAAVAAGNVEISQCVVNALFGCLGMLAAGQGTMNNIAFGNPTFQYYETLAGGTGAGRGFHGCSAVHSHMTNSRITDTELLESRFPVVVLHFGIRRGTGGSGQYHGGDGLVRSMLFLDDVVCSILSGQREVEPFGLNGGGNGASGCNRLLVKIARPALTMATTGWPPLLKSAAGGCIQQLIALNELELSKTFKTQQLQNRDSFNIYRGDVLVIETPGGGGYGKIVKDPNI